jgi:competence protein ComEA
MNMSKFIEKIKNIADSLDLLLISKIIVVVIAVAVFSSYYIGQKSKQKEMQQKSQELQQSYTSESSTDNVLADALNSENVVVHIKGEVKNPDVYTLTNQERVKDAIEKAGGITENADIDSINLAEKLYDSQEIYVPLKGSTQNQHSTSSSSKSSSGKTKNINAPININTATKEQLMMLPGIGESYAQRIIEYRSKNSGFKAKDEIMKIKGIGPSKYEEIKNKIII